MSPEHKLEAMRRPCIRVLNAAAECRELGMYNGVNPKTEQEKKALKILEEARADLANIVALALGL